MIERAEWRLPSGPGTPLGVHFGREVWLGLPVGLWVVLYSAGVMAVAFFLPRDFGKVCFIVMHLMLFQTETSRKDYELPEGAGALPPPQGWRERVARAFVSPAGDEETALVSLEPRPSPGPCFYVEIALSRRRRTTGGDLGVVAFSDGWLVFEGRNTAFAISPADVLKAKREKEGWTFSLPEDQGLRFVIDGNPEWEGEVVRLLAGPPPEGLSRLPPILPNRVRRLRIAGRLHVGACMVAGFGLGTALLKRMGVVAVKADWGLVGVMLGVAATMLVGGFVVGRRSRRR